MTPLLVTVLAGLTQHDFIHIRFAGHALDGRGSACDNGDVGDPKCRYDGHNE